jgi:hypothetical protein
MRLQDLQIVTVRALAITLLFQIVRQIEHVLSIIATMGFIDKVIQDLMPIIWILFTSVALWVFVPFLAKRVLKGDRRVVDLDQRTIFTVTSLFMLASYMVVISIGQVFGTFMGIVGMEYVGNISFRELLLFIISNAVIITANIVLSIVLFAQVAHRSSGLRS